MIRVKVKLAIPSLVQDVLFKTELELVELLDVPFEDVQSALAVISAKVCPPCHSVCFSTFLACGWALLSIFLFCVFFGSTNGLKYMWFKCVAEVGIFHS